MHIPLIIKGFLIGFSIAAPIGPVGILCIRRTLKRGRLSGFVSGLGTATMDAIYAVIAIFGITLIGDILVRYKDFLKIFAILFLIFLGHRIIVEQIQAKQIKNIGKKQLLTDFCSTAMITMSNPMTIFGLTAIFASIDITNELVSPLSGIMIISGVFLGSAFWRLILSHGTEFMGKKVNHNIIHKINKIAGISLIGFAFILIFSLFGKY